MTENENMEYRMQIEMFFESACMDYTDKDTSGRYARARMILDQHPEIVQFEYFDFPQLHLIPNKSQIHKPK